MLQNSIDEYRQAHLDDLSNAQSKVFSGLVETYEPNKLPEHIFVSYFLPGFMGNNPNKDWMLQWVSIAGSPNREVSVVDTSGQELFRVPAILPTQNLLLDNSNVTLNDIFAHSQTLSRTLQGGGHFLFDQLGRKVQEVPKILGKNSTQDAWSAIIARYNIVPVQAQPQIAPMTAADDFLEY